MNRRFLISPSARVEVEMDDNRLWLWIRPIGQGRGALRCIRIDKPIESGVYFGESHFAMVDNDILRLFPDEPIPELWRLFDANIL